VVDAVGLEDYVRGVVSRESPASWPAAALQAQAVAARTYAVTTSGGAATRGFDQYPDQRSQVYGGVSAEKPSTDAAVAATSGLVKGAFRGIKVVHRGASPRIVQAVVLGSKGRTTVNGPTLRKRFGLADSWVYFHFISTTVKKAPPPAPVELAPATDPAAPSDT